MPVPRTWEALDVLVDNVRLMQANLPVPLALENIAALLEWPNPELTEGQFLAELVERTECLLLVDVANLYANAQNVGVEPTRFVSRLTARHHQILRTPEEPAGLQPFREVARVGAGAGARSARGVPREGVDELGQPVAERVELRPHLPDYAKSFRQQRAGLRPQSIELETGRLTTSRQQRQEQLLLLRD